MRPEWINFLVQRSLYGVNPKVPKDFWDSEHLGIPVTEKKSNDVQSEYPKLPEYKSQFATIGVSLENIDANREIGMLQGYTFAKREMGSGRNRQRINYLEPERESQIVR